MIVFLAVLSIILTVISPSNGSLPAAPQKTVELGKVIDLRGTNLLKNFQEREKTIFMPFNAACFQTTPLGSAKKFMEYYANNNAFYSSLATQSELDVSLQSAYTLGTSLNVATNSKSSGANKVSGSSLNAMAKVEKVLVKRGCLEGNQAVLNEQFLNDLEGLPVKVTNPWNGNSWYAYNAFLRKYGSHVINSVTFGSSFKQMTFAESTKSYTERDFKVKSCVSLAGGGAGLDTCADVSQSEKNEASRMSTSNKVFILGGNADTRSKLLYQATRSNEMIQKLLNEAAGQPSPIKHTFYAIWKLLQARFPIGSANNIRGLNLENYYLGFLNYGCPPIASEGLQIQKFDYTKNSIDTSPEFECTLVKEGCHDDDDCHYSWGSCYCYGPTCVRYKSTPQDNGATKTTAFANRAGEIDDWDSSGCDSSWGTCYCYSKNRDRRQAVWSRPFKDTAQRKARIHGSHSEQKIKG